LSGWLSFKCWNSAITTKEVSDSSDDEESTEDPGGLLRRHPGGSLVLPGKSESPAAGSQYRRPGAIRCRKQEHARQDLLQPAVS
jgi:hypothetical protein